MATREQLLRDKRSGAHAGAGKNVATDTEYVLVKSRSRTGSGGDTRTSDDAMNEVTGTPGTSPSRGTRSGAEPEALPVEENDRRSLIGSAVAKTKAFGERTKPANRVVSVPNGLPRFLGNRSIVVWAWVGSMVVIGVNDWKNHSYLPNPSKFWYSSLLYGLLLMASLIEPLVPLVNALAIGYFLYTLWAFFNKTGQFA
jgi:hypothetical protein